MKTRILTRCLSCSLFLMILSNIGFANSDPIRVKAALVHYPPYSIYNQNGMHRGLVYDLLKEIDYMDIVFMPPKRAIAEYRYGNVDVLFFSDRGAYEILKSSSNFLPLFQGNTHLFYKKGNGNGGKISEKTLSNKTVSVIRGVEEEAQILKELGMKVIEVDSPEQSLKMLLRGNIDYSNMSILPMMYLLESNANKDEYKFSSQPTMQLNTGLFYLKDAGDHVKSAIKEIEESYLTDDYFSIIEKYLTPSQRTKDYLPNAR